MAEPETVVLILTTVPPELDAEALARALVAERLAACVSILPPMLSVYRWKGAVESASERQVIIKTTRPRVDALRARLVALHPYDLPEFVVLTASGGSRDYVSWVSAETRLD